jgi:hypothetical protein
MFEMLFQKTATSELWWIGGTLTLFLSIWLALVVFRLIKKWTIHHHDAGIQSKG